MAYVRDTWKTINPETGKKVRGPRFGVGKRWQAVWVENGREVTKSFTTEDTAEAFLADTSVAQRDGTYVPRANQGVTVGEMWPVWIGTKSTTSTSTRDGYTAAWKHIEKSWSEVPCSDVARTAVVTWLPTLTSRYVDEIDGKKVARPLGESSARKVMIVFHALMETAVELRVVPSNPLRLKDAPRQKMSERRYLTVAELDRLREAMPGAAEQLVVDVLVWTGLRPGEAFGLQCGDLDPARGRLRVSRDVDVGGQVDETKSRRHRDVPVGGELLWDLEDAAEGRGRGEVLLRDSEGGGWTRASWRPVWEAARAGAGLEELDTYELRHTAASLAIHSGANVKTVQRMLGHASAAMTLDIYGHLWDDELDALPAKMDAHMKSERARFEARRNRTERKLRAVPTEHSPSMDA